MNCPHCNRVINGMTGLQEIQKFQKHLYKCKKYQTGAIKPEYDENGILIGTYQIKKPCDMIEALNQRANSGQ